MKKIIFVIAALMSFSAFAQITSIRVRQGGPGGMGGSGSAESKFDVTTMKRDVFSSEKYLNKVKEVEQNFNIVCNGAQTITYENMQILASSICTGKAEILSYKVTVPFNLVNE